MRGDYDFYTYPYKYKRFNPRPYMRGDIGYL